MKLVSSATLAQLRLLAEAEKLSNSFGVHYSRSFKDIPTLAAYATQVTFFNKGGTFNPHEYTTNSGPCGCNGPREWPACGCDMAYALERHKWQVSLHLALYPLQDVLTKTA